MQVSSTSKRNTSAAISALISDVRRTQAWWPFVVTLGILVMVKLNVDLHGKSMFIADRFMPGTGWIEVVLAAVYAAWVYMHMKNPKEVTKWRKNTWLLFSAVFFSQLLLGIVADNRFLMSGKLHLPVPAVILAGPLYRMQLSFMPILFLSTVLITGPAWCSHLCYFGSVDNWASSTKTLRNKPLKNKMLIKHSFLSIFVLTALVFHLTGVPTLWATLAGALAGTIGLAVIIFFSHKKNKMVHCTMYCPIGTLVNYLRYVSPFRMSITESCTVCMACTLKCRYDALNLKDIQNGKPGKTCTYCGECVPSCHQQSIRYHFLGLTADKARNLYLILTISLHACFLVLARI